MNESHASLRDLYEVSSPELDAMVAWAQAQPQCYGAL
jgi:galactokinase